MSHNFSQDDIENILSQNNIIINANEVRVVKKRKLNSGYFQTINIQRIILRSQIRNQTQAVPRQIVLNSICLSIEDIKRATPNENHWKIFDLQFRKVLVYGMAVIENHYTKNGEDLYTISIDDETGVIMGTYKQFEKKLEAKQKATLTREVNQLNAKKGTGFNIDGTFFGAGSEESQFICSSVSNLQKMIDKNLQHLHKEFHQGPLKQKVLVYAKPFTFHNSIRLHIIDLWQCDHIELAWKRNLNKIYSTQYLK